MTCSECRELLPLHLYGDLPEADCQAVMKHLAGCVDCRLELDALSVTRAALDTVPVTARVDLHRIYRFQADAQRRATRRWRAAAIIGIAVAVLVLVMRLDIHADARQVTIRWGKPEPVAPAPEPQIVVRTETVAASPELTERLNMLTALIHALAANVETGERERVTELVRLRGELESLRQQDDQRWTETGRSVSALYAAQFGPHSSGDKP